MERLTKRRKDGHAEPAIFRQYVGQEMDDKLADYEDTGLSPEEVKQLKEDFADLKDEYDWFNEMKEIPTWED